MGSITSKKEYPEALDYSKWHFQHFYPLEKCSHLDSSFAEGHGEKNWMYFRKYPRKFPRHFKEFKRFNRLLGSFYRDITFWDKEKVYIL